MGGARALYVLYLLRARLKAGFRERLEAGSGCQAVGDSRVALGSALCLYSSQDWLQPVHVPVEKIVSYIS